MTKLWVLIETLPDQCEIVATSVWRNPEDAEKAKDRIEKETDSEVEILEIDGISTFKQWTKDFEDYLEEAEDESLSTEG
jgi:hypothetical protein